MTDTVQKFLAEDFSEWKSYAMCSAESARQLSAWQAAVAKALLAMEADAMRLSLALSPFAHFAEQWARNPIRGIADELYTIHAGDDAASLKLSDCQWAEKVLSSSPDARSSSPVNGDAKT